MLPLLAETPDPLGLGWAAPYVQLGAVGILAVIAFYMVKAVKWGFPKALEIHREALAQLGADHKESLAQLGRDHKEAQQATARANTAVCAQMLSTFKEESKECREERKEAAVERKQADAARAAEREADRQARHDDADVLQEAVNKIYLNQRDK